MSSMSSNKSGRIPLRSPRSWSRFRPRCLKLLIIRVHRKVPLTICQALLYILAGSVSGQIARLKRRKRRPTNWHKIESQETSMPQDTHAPNLNPDLRKTYDAIVVGSGAAGGMAAHVLTSHGLQVLMLEAGKKLPIEQELKSMQWPYDHPRRGKMPAEDHALTLNE